MSGGTRAGRKPLVGRMATGGLSAVALGGLGLLFLEARPPRPELVHPGRDSLAAAYLRVLVRDQPDGAALRLRLAREELALGRWADADRALAPLLERGAAPGPEVLWLSLEIALAAWRAAPAGAPDEVLARLDRLSGPGASAEDLARVAAVARSVARPDLAARAAERAAALAPRACARWLAQAARDFLAAGAPGSAARSYARACACGGDPGESRALGLAALEAHVSAGQGAEALRLAGALLDRFPEDRELLERAERLALGQGDPAQARRFAARLVRLGAVDRERLRRLLDLHLAAGDLGGAADAAERLASGAPADPEARRLAASAAAWAGRHARALAHWRWLARRGDASGAGEALQVARAIPDHGAVAELLVLQSRSRPLPPASLRELAQALDRAGPPGAALAALADQATRHPESRPAWETLAALQEEREALAPALATRAEIARRFGASLEASLPVARLHWALGRPDRALAELEGWSESAAPSRAEYWELVGELAWSVESDQLAARAYRSLWDAERIGPVGAERLLLLSREAGEADEAIRLGREGWARFGEPRLLLLAMDEAARGDRWDELARLDRAAAGAEGALAGLPSYWTLRARLDERRGRTAEAARSLRRALEADPGSAALRAELLWLLVRAGDREALARQVAAWEADAREEPALWRPYAAGLELLGRRREALSFHARAAAADPEDGEARARYLGALDAVRGPAPPRRAPTLQADLGGQSLGPALLRHAAVAASAPVGEGELQLRAGVSDVTSGARAAPLDQRAFEASAGAAWELLGGRTELSGGLRLKRGRIAPHGAAAHTRRLAPYAELRLEAAANERALESPDLLLAGARSRAGGALTLAAGGAYCRGGAEWRAWSREAGGALGGGPAGTLELGWRARVGEPEVALRVQGGLQRFEAAGLLGGAPALPDELRTFGLGASVERWRVGPALLLAEAWVGWISNPGRPAYRLQTGVELAPFESARLTVAAHAASDRWSAGPADFGLGAAFAYRLPEPPP